MIGKTANIYGRNFLIYDCDMFTKTFYTKNFGVSNFEPIRIDQPRQEANKMVKDASANERVFHSLSFRKFRLTTVSVRWKILCKIVYAFNPNARKKITLN